jgi:ABC-type uncharacterized transport system substrate-binding protein
MIASVFPILLTVLIAVLPFQMTQAHPHVFVDGGVDFVIEENTKLSEIRVTWIYDNFETLYVLSSYEISPNARGELSAEDRATLVELYENWPDDFDGSAHLFVADAAVPLAWPEKVDVDMVDGRLKVMFTRRLERPIDLGQDTLEVGFYENTYFFAFAITETPKLLGQVGQCSSQVRAFVADENNRALQTALAQLSREETPEDTNVGAIFADRIFLECAPS